MKKKNRAKILLAVLLAVALCLTGAEKLTKLYRDISFYWRERTAAEIRVKEYADEIGADGYSVDAASAADAAAKFCQ